MGRNFIVIVRKIFLNSMQKYSSEKSIPLLRKKNENISFSYDDNYHVYY